MRRGLSDLLGERPSADQVEAKSHWEVDLTDDGAAARGIRIYLPREAMEMRAYLPIPVSLHNRWIRIQAQRWLNPVFDAHYTLSVWQLYVNHHGVYSDSKLPDSTCASITQATDMVAECYRVAYARLATYEVRIAEMVMTEARYHQPVYTDRMEFVAAVSSADDRMMLGLLHRMDQVLVKMDGLYLVNAITMDSYGEDAEAIAASIGDMARDVVTTVRGMAAQITQDRRNARDQFDPGAKRG
ncbi:conserved hypothetical protein [Acidithiobacillus ferrivorans]|nr:conserved hypothetical protein [Acidithiobacillus ferrivorans]